jgi:hypothetical protein
MAHARWQPAGDDMHTLHVSGASKGRGGDRTRTLTITLSRSETQRHRDMELEITHGSYTPVLQASPTFGSTVAVCSGFATNLQLSMPAHHDIRVCSQRPSWSRGRSLQQRHGQQGRVAGISDNNDSDDE